jgi:hypothetical protein
LLNTALATLGIDPTGAPEGVFDLAGGTFCGFEEQSNFESILRNLAGRECFANALNNDTTAIFIMQRPTDEGDPVATVWRTQGGLDITWFDATRDKFGSGQWTTQSCPLVAYSADTAFDCAPAGPVVNTSSFCDEAAKLLQSPDLGAVEQLIVDLRAVDTTQLTQAQRGTYVEGIAALEDNVGSPNGYDTQMVTASVNQLCGTNLSTYYATP